MTDKNMIMTKAIFLNCIKCGKRFGILIVEEKQFVKGDEVALFLRANNIIPMCFDCHITTGINSPDKYFEVK